MPYPSKIDPKSLGAQTLALVEEQGWDSWSLRDVAKGLGVSANALYRYVKGKDELLVLMAQSAVMSLNQALREAPGDGIERVIWRALCYVNFATQRPHAYAVFVHAKPEATDPRAQAWKTLWQLVRSDFDEVLPRSSDAAAFAFWALVHGRVELARGPARLAAPTDGLEDAIRALCLGFGAMGRVETPLPEHIAKAEENS